MESRQGQGSEAIEMITFLIVVIWFFVVLPYLFRRVFPPAPVVTSRQRPP
jgi:hypothetical protein